MEHLLVSMGVSSSLAADIAFFLLLALIGLALGFFIGKYRLLSLLIAMYVAFVIFAVFPKEVLPDGAYVAAFFYLALVLLFTFLDTRLFRVSLDGAAIWEWILLGVLEVGMLTSICITLLPHDFVARILTTNALGYFAGDWAYFLWVVAPLAFLFFVNRK